MAAACLQPVSRGGGLGILTGIVTKFKKAHKPKSEATEAAADEYASAIIFAKGTASSTKKTIQEIKNLEDKYPSFDGTMKTLNGNIISCIQRIKEAEKSYQEAKKKELAIYTEFLKYMNEKEAKKEGDAKEYKEWKKQVEETIKELSKQ